MLHTLTKYKVQITVSNKIKEIFFLRKISIGNKIKGKFLLKITVNNKIKDFSKVLTLRAKVSRTKMCNNRWQYY